MPEGAQGPATADGERTAALEDLERPRSFVDLHCHSAASFDSLSKPADIVRLALERGLTHLAITDHERIDGA